LNETAKEKKAAYNLQYNKDHITQIKFSFNNVHDLDILEHLQKQPNKQAYIKNLVRKDIKKGGEKIDSE